MNLKNRIAELMDSVTLQNKALEIDEEFLNENIFNENLQMKDLKFSFGRRMYKNYEEFYKDISYKYDSIYFETENVNIKFDKECKGNCRRVLITPLYGAMKSNKPIRTSIVILEKDNEQQFWDLLKQIGIVEFIKTKTKYLQIFDMSSGFDTNGLNLFSPFVLMNIKPLKRLPEIWDKEEILKVITNKQYVFFEQHYDSKTKSVMTKDVFDPIGFIEEMYSKTDFPWRIIKSTSKFNIETKKSTTLKILYGKDEYEIRVDIK